MTNKEFGLFLQLVIKLLENGDKQKVIEILEKGNKKEVMELLKTASEGIQ